MKHLHTNRPVVLRWQKVERGAHLVIDIEGVQDEFVAMSDEEFNRFAGETGSFLMDGMELTPSEIAAARRLSKRMESGETNPAPKKAGAKRGRPAKDKAKAKATKGKRR